MQQMANPIIYVGGHSYCRTLACVVVLIKYESGIVCQYKTLSSGGVVISLASNHNETWHVYIEPIVH